MGKVAREVRGLVANQRPVLQPRRFEPFTFRQCHDCGVIPLCKECHAGADLEDVYCGDDDGCSLSRKHWGVDLGIDSCSTVIVGACDCLCRVCGNRMVVDHRCEKNLQMGKKMSEEKDECTCGNGDGCCRNGADSAPCAGDCGHAVGGRDNDLHSPVLIGQSNPVLKVDEIDFIEELGCDDDGWCLLCDEDPCRCDEEEGGCCERCLCEPCKCEELKEETPVELMEEGVCEDPISLICGPHPFPLLVAPADKPVESMLDMIMAGKEVELAVDFFTKPEEAGAAYTERVRGEIRIIENSAGEKLVLIYCEDVMPVGMTFEHVERGLFNIEVEFRKLAQSYLNQKYGMLPLKKDVPD